MPNQTLAAWLNPHLSTQMLSLFGFKKPHDFLVFLKSPAMNSLKALITKKIDELEVLRQNTQHQHDKKRLRHSLMFLLGIAYKEKAKAAARHEADVQQAKLNKKLHPKKSSMLGEIRTAFEAAAYAIAQELTSNTALLDKIELAWHASEQNEAQLFTDLIEDEDHVTYHDRELTYALPQKPYIFYHDGKFYLLSRGVSFDTLTPDAKEKAHQAYLTLKPRFEILSKKTKGTHQEKRETHDKIKATLIQHVTQVHKENHSLAQKIAVIHALLNTPNHTPQLNHPALTHRLFFKLNLKPPTIISRQQLKASFLKPLADTPELLPEKHMFKQGANYDRLMRALTLLSIHQKRPDFVAAATDIHAPTTAPSSFKTRLI